MVFLKRHWLFASAGLVVLLCVALGVSLVWRANQPVEPKTVYAMPEPNSERAEILKRALQPPPRVYTAKASSDEAATDNTNDDSLQTVKESSSRETKFGDTDHESMLAAIHEEPAEEKGDFPPIPDDFPSHFKPVWLAFPGYKKGDMLEHELMYRVLIKLWNQGDHGFVDAVTQSGRVYPIYPDVVYIRWVESEIGTDEDGNPITARYIGQTTGTEALRFKPSDFLTGAWKTKYPSFSLVEFDDAGYDPYTFLAEND